MPSDHENVHVLPLPEALPITTPSTAHLTVEGELAVFTVKLTVFGQFPLPPLEQAVELMAQARRVAGLTAPRPAPVALHPPEGTHHRHGSRP